MVAIATLGGCSSDDTSAGDDSGGPCAARSGTYLLTRTETSGTCGPVSDQVVAIDGPENPDPNTTCTGGGKASADNCTVNVNSTCTYIAGPYKGYTLKTAGTVRWNASGSTGTGTLQQVIEGASPNDGCSSVYAVKYTRN